jgi:hypothetical protein
METGLILTFLVVIGAGVGYCLKILFHVKRRLVFIEKSNDETAQELSIIKIIVDRKEVKEKIVDNGGDAPMITQPSPEELYASLTDGQKAYFDRDSEAYFLATGKRRSLTPSLADKMRRMNF